VDSQTLPLEGSQIVVKGDRFTSSGMGVTSEGKLTVAVATKPWANDLKLTQGPEIQDGGAF